MTDPWLYEKENRTAMTVRLKPHQEEAVLKLDNGNILRGGVGSGKTIVSIWYYISRILEGTPGDLASYSEPVDLYVITTAKKRDSLDWEKDLAKLGLSTEADLNPLNVRVTIDSWNNIGKYREAQDAFFIFDEQRLVGSGAWTKHFLKIAESNRWILLTATPGDTWLDYIPVFVANGFYKNRTEFKFEHVIYNHQAKFPKVDRYVGEQRLYKLKAHLLVEMPYERHTVRHTHTVPVEYDRDLFKQVSGKRWHVYKERPIRDVSELFATMRRVGNSDASRFFAVRTLLRTHPKMIVFYNFDYELEMLRELAEDVTVAEWNGHKHEPIPTTDSWVYLVQYTAGAEGWNCVETDTVVFWSLNYSYKIFEQAHGRIDRMNTPFTDLHYYVLISKSPMDVAVMRALREKRNFNESQYQVLVDTAA